jgi:hypothetical protein
VEFTIEQRFDVNRTAAMGSTPICNSAGGCNFEWYVCMHLNTGAASCQKKNDTVSHVCFRGGANNEAVCRNYDGGFTKNIASQTIGSVRNKVFCETVEPGYTAEFILKDGNGNNCGTSSEPFVQKPSCLSSHEVSCRTATASCSGSKLESHCSWSYKTPDCSFRQ